MYRYLFVALAACAIATPALALERTPYVGVGGGILHRQSTNLDEVGVDFSNPGLPDGSWKDLLKLSYTTGYDVDAVVGLDLGALRLEGELGYKAAKLKGPISIKSVTVDADEDRTGKLFDKTELKVSGRTTVISGMANVLLDGHVGRPRVYGGAGLGLAHVKSLAGSGNAWAYQLIAGITVPVGRNLEAGLKYRFFRTARLRLADSAEFSEGRVFFRNDPRIGSHSLLATLIMNFGTSGRGN